MNRIKVMYKKYTMVIQAGGKGTRMRELTGDEVPKPMLSLNGKPMIQWQIESAARYGIEEIIIITGYLGKKIRGYFGNGKELGIHITYIEEQEALGSAGALYFLKDKLCTEDFLLVFGDVMFEVDLIRMFHFHERHGKKVTLLVHPNAHPFDSDLLKIENDNLVTGIDFKNQERNYWYDNCVNAGIFLLSKKVIEGMERAEKLDLERNVLVPLIEKKEVYAYYTPEYVKDIGAPERFSKAAAEQKEGVWEKKCLKRKQRCFFLDRDGTLNQYRGLVSDENDFELEETVGQAIRKINESGFLAIVVTNQPVVARGLCDIEDVKKIHRKMQTLLGGQGAYLDDIVFCPHHPDKGYPEERVEYKIPCRCRKPDTGMIEKMAKKYNIDLKQSYMIGDSTVDIQTGINAGIHTILVNTGQKGMDGKYKARPEYTAKNLLDAVNKVLYMER